MKKWFCCLLAVILLLATACGEPGEDFGDPNANDTVPDGSLRLEVTRAEDQKEVWGIGAQLDPFFFSRNAGHSGTGDQGSWSCETSDWEEIYLPRIREMNLKQVRMMLWTSWYVGDEEQTLRGEYNFDSSDMQSMVRTLESLQSLGVRVNVTMWGINTGVTQWMRAEGESHWVTYPKEEYEELFVKCFADCIKYLIVDKGLTCIEEVTLFNEPNTLYPGVSGVMDYCDLCVDMDEAFRTAGIRDKVLFNLSDDAREPSWLAATLGNLEGIIDLCNSHIYTFGDSHDSITGETTTQMSNADICYNLPNYNLALYREMFQSYDIPFVWGEFGALGSIKSEEGYIEQIGVEVPRIMLNMFNMGAQGMSYWLLFAHSRSDPNDTFVIDQLGLWSFADENYLCRPAFYSYSMFTRFVERGDEIFPIESADGNIVATAFRRGDQWTYCVVNNAQVSKSVSFVNRNKFPGEMTRYLFEEASVPTDNAVIPASGTEQADGRVVTVQVPPRSVLLLTQLPEVDS